MPRKLEGGRAQPVFMVDEAGEPIDSINPLPVVNSGTIAVQVVGDTVRISVTPPITAGLYAAGDALGDRLEFVDAVLQALGFGTITKVVIIDNASQNAPIDIVFFDRPFTATADNAAFDPSDADLQNCIGYIDIPATDYAVFNDNSVAAKSSGLRMPFDFVLGQDSTIYAQMAIRDGATYVAVTDITVIITVERK